MSRDTTYLLDILLAARRIREVMTRLPKEDFMEDWIHQSAVVRQLEIIGEATKRLSESFRDTHPEIPWRSMAGMRDVVIHSYDHVDLTEVWKVSQDDVVQLIVQLEKLIPPEETIS